jgi:uncharacterized protein YfaP (DUF2135 family)
MNAFRLGLMSATLYLALAVNTVMAQANAALEFYGHYFTQADANRVVTLINEGNAPGWSGAVAEQSPNSVTGTFGVYARRVAPQRNDGDNKLPPVTKNMPQNPGITTNPELAVTITWNTKTDIDLWVTEPDGTRCSYQNRKTNSGGILHEDNVTGFGPEHYTTQRGARGVYVISVNDYRGDVPTTVNVQVTRFAGTPNQTTHNYTVQLQRSGQTVEVCRIQF